MIQVLFQTKKLIKLPQIVPLLHIYPLREPDPSSVQFTFIKTEGSQEHGILMTHQQMAQSACIKGRNDMTIR